MTTPAPRSSGRGYEYGGPAFPGGILVGVGLGIMLGDFFAWLPIGIRAGFVLMGLIAQLCERTVAHTELEQDGVRVGADRAGRGRLRGRRAEESRRGPRLDRAVLV